MKNLLLIFALTLVTVACKRKFTCNCTITKSGVTEISSKKTDKMKKSDAKSACEGHNGSIIVNEFGTTYPQTTDCKLK